MAGVLFIITILSKEEEHNVLGNNELNQGTEYESLRKTSTKSKHVNPGATPTSGGSLIDIAPKKSKFQFPPVQITINDEPLIETFANEQITPGSSSATSQQAPRKSWDSLKGIITSRNTEKKKKEHFNKLDLPVDASMEFVLQEILKKFNIDNASWTKANDGKTQQIIFTIEFDEKYELILDTFQEWGIGYREGSTVSVVNCNAFSTYSKNGSNCGDSVSRKFNAQKQTAWNRFMNSVTARLKVAQIVREVRQEAAITFDFIILVIAAAILASFGLVENSIICLTSSMLISPLMGPIIAGIFGTVIKDQSLRSLGVLNELIGLLIATCVGFMFGIIMCSIDERYGIGEGLTTEMISRCELHSLIVGIFTAIPSGAAAAIGILGGNTGSLVGVAISASLLPPAVNSGLLWALACLFKIYEGDANRYNFITKTNIYSNDQASELAILGSVSMSLTILNIMCIYVMGIIVLKIKEVAPVLSRSNLQFWKHDIKIARDFNINGFDEDNAIMDEFAALPKEEQEALGLNYDFLRNINLDNGSYQNTWSPRGNRHPFELFDDKESYTTIHKFERLYNTHRMPRASLSIPVRNVFFRDRLTSIKSSNEKQRRATLPSELFLFKQNRLGILGEGSQAGTDTESMNSEDSKSRRKFIVTPADDPLQSKK